MKKLGLFLAFLLWPLAALGQQQIDATDITLGPSGTTCLMRTGSGAPQGGNRCDFYLDRSTGDLYSQVTAGVWSRLPQTQTANTFTGLNTIAATTPRFSLNETGMPVDQRIWSLVTSGGVLYVQQANDTLTGGNYFTFSRDGSLGNNLDLTLRPLGDLITDPTGKDILPVRNYDINIGALNKKYLSLSIANLLVESLVAQDVMATIGGHIMVAPTTQLTADVNTSGSPPVQGFCSKDNNMVAGDIVYLQTAPGGVPQFEAWQITTAATNNPACTPPIAYGATGLSGVYNHQWYAGDAIVNTGQVGAGYLDIYAMSNIRGLTYGKGPSLVGNVRTGTGFNDISPRWVLGNLNNAGYGHTSDVYGFAAGNPAGPNFFIDATYGFYLRFGQGAAAISMTPAGVATFSGVGTGITSIDGGNIQTQTITGNQIAANTITAGNLAAGSVTTAKLAVGAGANMIANAECRTGTVDWHLEGFAFSTFSYNYGGSGWSLNNEPSTCYYTDAGTPSTGVATYGISRNYPAVAGGTYEASIYLGNHRINSYVALQFLDTSGAILSSNNGTGCTMADGTGGSILTGYCRSGAIAVAPANTSTARLVIVSIATGEAGPFVFFVRAYLGQTAPGATQLANWSPAGLTLIDGATISTNAIKAGMINTGAVTTGTIAAGAVTAGTIATGAVTAGTIAAGAVTAGTINVSQLSAITADMGSLVAGQIVVGSSNKLWLNDANDGGIHIGGTNKNAAPFQVDAGGTINATSGYIGGVSIYNNGLVAGGSVTLDNVGITIESGSLAGNQVKWKSGSFTDGYARAGSGTAELHGSGSVQLTTGGANYVLLSGSVLYGQGLDLGSSGNKWGTLWSSGAGHFDSDVGMQGTMYSTGIAAHTGTGGGWTGPIYNINYSQPNVEFYSGNSFIGYFNMTYSDLRLKKNIEPLTVGLAAVLKLQPRMFEWTEPDRPKGKHYGLIAQDVVTVLPAVAFHGTATTPETLDGTWGVDYLEIVPVLVRAIQELDARIKALEARR
jgi:hypothetical protein